MKDGASDYSSGSRGVVKDGGSDCSSGSREVVKDGGSDYSSGSREVVKDGGSDYSSGSREVVKDGGSDYSSGSREVVKDGGSDYSSGSREVVKCAAKRWRRMQMGRYWVWQRGIAIGPRQVNASVLKAHFNYFPTASVRLRQSFALFLLSVILLIFSFIR